MIYTGKHVKYFCVYKSLKDVLLKVTYYHYSCCCLKLSYLNSAVVKLNRKVKHFQSREK